MKTVAPYDPPEWPLKVLRSFCNPKLVEEVEGDLLETFDERVKTKSPKMAKWLFYRDVLSMFRPFAIRKFQNRTTNSITMLASYFKLTIRGIKSNLMTSLISIFGLSIAVSCCIVLFLVGMNIITANDFIADADKIYLVASHTKDVDNNKFVWGKSPEILGPTVLEDENAIQLMTRVKKGSAVVQYGTTVIEEQIEYVDPDFLKIFSFELTDGTISCLNDPNKIVMSAKAAVKFFGENYPLGEELNLIVDGTTIPVVVGAVAAEFETNSYFDFNILVPYAQAKSLDLDWTKMTSATFFRIDNQAEADQLNSKSQAYVTAYNAKKPRYGIEKFEMIPFDQLTKTDYQMVSAVVGRENPSTLLGLWFFGGLLLFIACFNYINIAVVSAAKRLKEIGLRKSVGATKSQLVVQFLSQNIFMCSFAVITGLILAQALLLPIFNSFFPFDLGIDFTNLTLWLFLIGVAFTTGIISGIYPAFYVTSFSANNILKGKEKLGSSQNYLFKFFMGIQFVFTFFIIFSGIAFISNSHFQKNIDWGYQQSGLIVIPTNNAEQYTKLYNQLLQYPEIESLSGAKNHIGEQASSLDIIVNDEKRAASVYKVDANYLATMGITIMDGRSFNPSLASDLENGIIMNEKFANKFMISDLASGVVKTEDKTYQILGTVEDFHYSNFYFPIDAMAFIVSSKEENNFLIARVNSGSINSVNSKIKADWNAFFSDYPYNGYFQQDIFDEFFRQMSIPTNILITFAIISIILSSMGLFGLVSLMLTKRMKELSIRKVLGASMKEISLLTNRPFVVILGVALIIAIPTSQWLIKMYLDQVNAFHAPVDLTITIPSAIILLTTVVITIGANLIKVSKANPVEALAEK